MQVLTQFMVRKTEIVGASNQIHTHLQGFEATSGVTRFARQAGQSLSKGAIQTFDESGVEDYAATRAVKQFLRLLQQTVS